MQCRLSGGWEGAGWGRLVYVPGIYYAVSLGDGCMGLILFYFILWWWWGGGDMGLILKYLYDPSFTNRNYIYTLYTKYVNIVYNPPKYIKG